MAGVAVDSALSRLSRGVAAIPRELPVPVATQPAYGRPGERLPRHRRAACSSGSPGGTELPFGVIGSFGVTAARSGLRYRVARARCRSSSLADCDD
jgi:hypothetical protein